MTKPTAPPIYAPLIDDPSNAVPALPWILFFNAVFSGDTGTIWIPNFTGLSHTGSAPTITGNTYQITSTLSVFTVRIVPAAGTNITGTAGTTFITNYPLTMSGDGMVVAVSGLLGTNSGMCDFQSNHIYPPGWAAVTVPLTLIGMVEAS